MKFLPQIVILFAAAVIVSACRVPKAIVVQEPRKQEAQAAPTQTTAAGPELPGKSKGRSDDAPRVPDMLNQLPDERDFQPTNPSAARNSFTEGAVVAKPPSSTPPPKDAPKNKSKP